MVRLMQQCSILQYCPGLPGAGWAGVRCHMWRLGPAVVVVTTGNVLRLISGPVVSLVARLMWSHQGSGFWRRF